MKPMYAFELSIENEDIVYPFPSNVPNINNIGFQEVPFKLISAVKR